jgi:hypothetical protein
MGGGDSKMFRSVNEILARTVRFAQMLDAHSFQLGEQLWEPGAYPLGTRGRQQCDHPAAS